MTVRSFRLPPVAIGGVGGSGTRVAARILSETGCYVGGELNQALDNLWFSALLRRNSWFRQFPPRAEITRALQIFRASMETGLLDAIDAEDQEILDKIQGSLSKPASHSPPLLEQALSSLTQSEGGDPDQYARWGWKEPNTHIFLPYLAEVISDLRYVHVIRNGLDMAFSENQKQLYNWGPYILGPSARDQGVPLPVRSLEYWVAANERAVSLAREAFGANFFLLNYDRLCTSPDEVIPDFLTFLGVDHDPAELAAFIKPRSIGRHANENLDLFSGQQLQRAEDLMAIA